MQAGREYDTTDMSEQQLRNVYLPPYKAAIDAGMRAATGLAYDGRAGSFGCDDSGVTSSVRHIRSGIEARTSSS